MVGCGWMSAGLMVGRLDGGHLNDAQAKLCAGLMVSRLDRVQAGWWAD